MQFENVMYFRTAQAHSLEDNSSRFMGIAIQLKPKLDGNCQFEAVQIS